MVQLLTPRRQATPSAIGFATLGLALLALLTPFTKAEFPVSRVGFLIAFAAAIEMLHALRRSSAEARRRATVGAVISMAIALFLINAPFLATEALRYAIAGWFGLDAIRYALGAVRAPDRPERTRAALAALGNAAVAAAVLLLRGWGMAWIVSAAGAARIFGVAWNIMTAPVYTTAEADTTIIDDFGLGSQPEAVAMAADVEAEEEARASIDRGWTIAFIVTLFAIHIGRMQTDFTILGLISPAVAVLGDMVVAVLVTLLVINPVYLLWRRPTRLIVRPVWHEYVRRVRSGRNDWLMRISAAWLRWRLRAAIRLRAARYSISAALNQGLQTGLPIAAVIAATVPVWGMSWYFDTENWAAGIWNSWAASRTDTWREAMVRAVLGSGAPTTPTSFAVEPDGIASGDFSFIVIGDPGEGDASQHVLRDQLLAVANAPGVCFVVISSDVVYPTGAMKDYEARFWLPFKGVTRPVYAIPGNHDWYDALEAFAATFFQPDAARAAIRARAEADLRVTSTTGDRIEELIGEAAALRQAYGVPTGFQRAPFFELQTDRFALVAIDTGVLRQVDPQQTAWLESALDRAAGKFTMAVLGHPFLAGGHDVSVGDDEFTRLRQLLRSRGVAIVMAGDTHDLEYYAEPGPAGEPAVHHFVNGGGGAYMSFGTSLDWPDPPPTRDWAYYPGGAAVMQKIEARTPWWKRPAWWWTRQFGAWPFTAEWLSAAFDYNVAPFFQSFLEVKVERSANRVRILPYGVHGRLTWGEIAASDRLRASGEGDRAFVEWVVPLTPLSTR